MLDRVLLYYFQAETRAGGKAAEERRRHKVFLFYTKVIYMPETCAVRRKAFVWMTDKKIEKERERERYTERL